MLLRRRQPRRRAHEGQHRLHPPLRPHGHLREDDDVASPRAYFDEMLARGDGFLDGARGTARRPAAPRPGCYSAHSGIKAWQRRAQCAVLLGRSAAAIDTALMPAPPTRATTSSARGSRSLQPVPRHPRRARRSSSPTTTRATSWARPRRSLKRSSRARHNRIARRIDIPMDAATQPVVVFNPAPVAGGRCGASTCSTARSARACASSTHDGAPVRLAGDAVHRDAPATRKPRRRRRSAPSVPGARLRALPDAAGPALCPAGHDRACRLRRTAPSSRTRAAASSSSTLRRRCRARVRARRSGLDLFRRDTRGLRDARRCARRPDRHVGPPRRSPVRAGGAPMTLDRIVVRETATLVRACASSGRAAPARLVEEYRLGARCPRGARGRRDRLAREGPPAQAPLPRSGSPSPAATPTRSPLRQDRSARSTAPKSRPSRWVDFTGTVGRRPLRAHRRRHHQARRGRPARRARGSAGGEHLRHHRRCAAPALLVARPAPARPRRRVRAFQDQGVQRFSLELIPHRRATGGRRHADRGAPRCSAHPCARS